MESMDTTEEKIVFKKPVINAIQAESNADKIEKSAPDDQQVDSNTQLEPTAQTVSKTVLPEPMTRLLPPEGNYFLDQLKNGVIVDHKLVVKSRLVFGRALDCDVVLEHPSVSRYHAVLLWSPTGDEDYSNGKNLESFWYLVDCGSTHGTHCNKSAVMAGKLIKLIPNNNVFKFGASTRLFTLGTTIEDSDEDTDDDIEENTSKVAQKTKNSTEDVDNGCSWGIDENEADEAVEETADSKSLQAIIAAMKGTGSDGLQTDNSNAYSANPNKSIQQWFEREGYDLEFKCDSMHNKFKCIIDLPIDGQWIPVEGSLLQKKREAITDACLKCCQLLDKAELLFPWQQQKAKAKRRKQNEDMDSDSEMIDETVDVRRKRAKRDSESTDTKIVDTYDSLNQKWQQLNEELRLLRIKLANTGVKPEDQYIPDPKESGDSLDDFMAAISQKKYGLSMNDKIEKSKIKMNINLLEKEQQKLEKLLKLAKPSAELPAISAEIITKTKPSLTETEVKSESVPQLPNTSTENSNSVENTSDSEKQNPESIESNEPKTEKMSKTDRTIEIQQKTEQIINELKNSSQVQNSKSASKAKQRLKAQSIVDAIENEKKLEKSKPKETFDSDYVDWLPPVDQSGDGKTNLNDRFGY